MSAHDFLLNIVLICTAMAIFAAIEVIVPLFARGESARGRLGANFGLSLLTLLFNWALISAAAVIAQLHAPQGWLAQFHLSFPALALISIAVLDLSTYFAHLLMHKIPALWRAHRVHHSDTFLDVTTTLRQHPVEGLWRFAWVVVPAWFLGLPAAGVALYRLVSVVQGIVEHSNIRLWRPLDKPLSLIWCTPNMHKIHHSNLAKQTDSNYGNIFAVFDRLFWTFTPTDRAYGVTYGLTNVGPEQAKSLPELLAMPFETKKKEVPA